MKQIKEKKSICRNEDSIWLATTPGTDYVNVALIEAEAAKSLGLPAYIEEKVPIPIPVKGAVCFYRQAQFHPRKYLLGLAEMIQGNGCMVFEKTRATGIKEYGRKGFLINTTTADIEAKNVVIATNFPFYDKPGKYYARMEAGRIYSFAMKLNTGFPDGIFISAEKDIYSFRSQPYKDGELIIAGGQEHVTGKVEDTMARFVKLFKYVKQYYDVDHIEFCWSSQDNNTFDLVPYIGRYLPDGKNIYVATGFNGWGMTHGTISAMIITDMILGIENPWSGIYDPARFKLRADNKSETAGRTFKKGDSGRIVKAGRSKTDSYDKIKKIQNINEYLKDLPPGDGKIAEISGTKVALYKHIDGNGYFLNPLCPHMGCLLRFNGAEKSWDCPCHGSRFSFDGKVLNSPAFEDLEILLVYKNNDA